MKRKQNLVKRTVIAVGIGGLSMFSTFSLTGRAEEMDENIPIKVKTEEEVLVKEIKKITDSEEREVFLGDTSVIYDEYSFVDTTLSYQVTIMVPRYSGLESIIEICNLKTGSYFYDYGLNGFEGELEDGFVVSEVNFDLSFKSLNYLYKDEIKKVLSLLPVEAKDSI